ncbi:MAG: AbrB/MazE/SpoVT family DNA-binding domain-containing protein [Myxococcales bacterium]|nr:AbrB/MazE/SpoVT family DNA-binding domain-containing protein [Myxococcales bacterium]
MVREITIDAAGRLVIPKSMRERLHLTAGTRLYISEEGDHLLISPARPEPALVERDGVLGIDVGGNAGRLADHEQARDERLRDLIDYALRR